jgi:hypothetical protein
MAAGMTWQYLRGELSVRLEQLEATSGQTAACEVARLRAEVAAGPVMGWPWPVRGRLTFPNGAPHPLPPYGELTEPQQRVVRTLADHGPDTWRWANFISIMRTWNLPSAQAECRAYAGLDPP